MKDVILFFGYIITAKIFADWFYRVSIQNYYFLQFSRNKKNGFLLKHWHPILISTRPSGRNSKRGVAYNGKRLPD